MRVPEALPFYFYFLLPPRAAAVKMEELDNAFTPVHTLENNQERQRVDETKETRKSGSQPANRGN